jgi:hypothetical protein
VNQAKRGYDVTEDEAGLMWYNPWVWSGITIFSFVLY